MHAIIAHEIWNPGSMYIITNMNVSEATDLFRPAFKRLHPF